MTGDNNQASIIFDLVLKYNDERKGEVKLMFYYISLIVLYGQKIKIKISD